MERCRDNAFHSNGAPQVAVFILFGVIEISAGVSRGNSIKWLPLSGKNLNFPQNLIKEGFCEGYMHSCDGEFRTS